MILHQTSRWSNLTSAMLKSMSFCRLGKGTDGKERMKLSRQAKTMLPCLALPAALVALLAFVTLTNFCQRNSARDRVRRNATVASLACIRTVLIAQKPLPDALAELTVGFDSQPALLLNSNLQDSWGQPFLYRKVSETNFILRSSGPDRRMGNNDDLF